MVAMERQATDVSALQRAIKNKARSTRAKAGQLEAKLVRREQSLRERNTSLQQENTELQRHLDALQTRVAAGEQHAQADNTAQAAMQQKDSQITALAARVERRNATIKQLEGTCELLHSEAVAGRSTSAAALGLEALPQVLSQVANLALSRSPTNWFLLCACS